jgi:hypothetical protein
MNTLLFVAISAMSCKDQVLVGGEILKRCRFEKEIIVKAQALKELRDQRYLLGPVSPKPSVGCQILLENGEVVMGGKPCRKLMGQ